MFQAGRFRPRRGAEGSVGYSALRAFIHSVFHNVRQTVRSALVGVADRLRDSYHEIRGLDLPHIAGTLGRVLAALGALACLAAEGRSS